MVKVVFLAPCALRGRARYNPGERAAFPPDVAEELIRLGIARSAEPVTEEETSMVGQAKAPAGPLWDKMISRAPLKKKIP